MPIFIDEGDYRSFVSLLGDVAEEFDIHCFSYCAMPNHYHVSLRPNRPNLSEAIRHLNSRYAQWWNRRHERVGHVFQGRFKDQIVQREGYFSTLCRYIALNPVRAKLVENPQDWPWSSYAATIGLRPTPAFLAIDEVLGIFGEGDQRLLQTRFAEYVLTRTIDEESMYDAFRARNRVLGDKAFKMFVKSEAGDKRASVTVDAVVDGAEKSILE